ncbi:MAG: hypothetical protein AMXMBFR33_40200 [Candidatus Xenobia bacterium]
MLVSMRLQSPMPTAPLRAAAGPGDAVSIAYYDAARDQAEAQSYYGQAGKEQHPAQLFLKLSKLLERTHTTFPGYEPAKYVFPRLDRRPDGELSCLYTTRRVLTEQGETWSRLALASPLDAAGLGLAVAAEESRPRLTAEHVVARDWFDDRQPMRGDLHNLFACDKDVNEERGSTPLGEAGPDRIEVRGGWLSPDGQLFEPREGKGPAARATLYFLTRYPGAIHCYGRKEIETLLRWHREDPVSTYERHHNREAFLRQGNRNPYIDHPDWAEKIFPRP